MVCHDAVTGAVVVAGVVVSSVVGRVTTDLSSDGARSPSSNVFCIIWEKGDLFV